MALKVVEKSHSPAYFPVVLELWGEDIQSSHWKDQGMSPAQKKWI